MAVLLMASLVIMLYYSRKAVKEEALQKASQTLEATVQRIDNVLLSVEQATGNIFFSMWPHLNRPEMMHDFCRKLLESNPNIAGCAVAFKEDYFKDRKTFMAYVFRSDNGSLTQSNTFGDRPYTEQIWFTRPMASGRAEWIRLDVPIITFCLPFPGPDGQPRGVLAVDVSLSRLSSIIAAAKPSANSYCTLLDSDGSYIIHPNRDRLIQQSIFHSGDDTDPSVKEAAQAMLSGETGYRPFRLNGTDYYIFYEPFTRNAVAGHKMDDLNWSAGIIYPEDDIFGDYNSLTYYVLAISLVGLLLLFVLSRTIIHRHLKPLLMLTASAQRIAKGNYSENIPPSRQQDEIGLLQDNFQQMQQSLATHIGQLEQLTTTLQERGKKLSTAYDHAKKADRMKIAFLHNMTNQMTAPAEAIDNAVNELCKAGQPQQCQDTRHLTDDIQRNGSAIAELLNNLIKVSDEERKEVGV